jgi:hypothetical protein
VSAPTYLLYRGPLASCNYACGYCPFAKRRDDAAALRADEAALERFVDWASGRADLRLEILFTPWGEALVRRWYRRAMVELSRLPQVARVAIQTNLSAGLEWLEEADPDSLALWATYHPGEVSRARFLERCRTLARAGVRYSVGLVGRREHLDELEPLRAALPPEVYLWVNAVRRDQAPYTPAEVARIEAVDPLFGWNLEPHPSRGHACHTGEDAFAVDGAGDLRRCHFVGEVLGNLYRAADLERARRPRPCPEAECRCHIGYVHKASPDLRAVYGPGLMERIPLGWPAREAVAV